MKDPRLSEEILSSQEMLKGSFLHLEKLSVRLPDGRPASREVVRHPGGVAVLTVDDEDMVILVQQYRTAFDDIILEIPAGKLDCGEEPDAAAVRELSEETGCTADSMIHLAAMATSCGFTDEVLHLYLATGLHEAAAHPDDGEFLRIVRMPFAQLYAKVCAGEIMDGKTIAAVMLASVQPAFREKFQKT